MSSFLLLIEQYIAGFIAIIVVVVLLIIVSIFLPRKDPDLADEERIDEVDPLTMKTKNKENQAPKIVHDYDKYPIIYTFEVLYWNGVEEPWRWNSFAQDLLKYSQEHLPLKKVEFDAYNANTNDPNYKANARRIEQLRLQKIRRFPLVSINGLQGPEELSVINSSYAYNEMLRRIDAEWDRYYGLV